MTFDLLGKKSFSHLLPKECVKSAVHSLSMEQTPQEEYKLLFFFSLFFAIQRMDEVHRPNDTKSNRAI